MLTLSANLPLRASAEAGYSMNGPPGSRAQLRRARRWSCAVCQTRMNALLCKKDTTLPGWSTSVPM